MDDKEDVSVRNFREYLRIKTDHPHPDYESCTKFLVKLAEDVGIESRTVEPHPGKPFVIMTVPGKDPSLSTLLLYSHTDVVPAYSEYWKYDPFGAVKDEEGNIYGRGTQDMKSVGIQYVEAVRRLKKAGKSMLRTIHMLFGPDEEIGGFEGMGKFVEDGVFKELRVGFVLDEGVPWPDDTYRIYNGERCLWPVKVTCTGNPGHGSKFIENTAAEKMQKIMNFMLDFREREYKKMMEHPDYTLGSVTTINMTKIEGGVQINVVPAELVAYFDIRIPPTENFEAFEERLKSWMEQAGPGVSFQFEPFKYTLRDITPLDESNPWWMSMKSVFDKLGLKYKTDMLGGGTDSRFLRERGYPALHFSPMIHTPQLLHDHNELLNESVFLDGVGIYVELISALGDLKRNQRDEQVDALLGPVEGTQSS